MTELNLPIKAGELVVFSAGEYSDYGYLGQFVVLEDITSEDITKVLEGTAEELRKESNRWSEDLDFFIPVLIRMGKLASINMREIHLGSYGELDPLIAAYKKQGE